MDVMHHRPSVYRYVVRWPIVYRNEVCRLSV